MAAVRVSRQVPQKLVGVASDREMAWLYQRYHEVREYLVGRGQENATWTAVDVHMIFFRPMRLYSRRIRIKVSMVSAR